MTEQATVRDMATMSPQAALELAPDLAQRMSEGRPARILNYKPPIETRQYGIVISRELNLAKIGSFITPLDVYCLRSHFNYPPAQDPRSWTVRLEGAFRSPAVLTLEDILRYPAQTRVVMMECTGNSHSTSKDIKKHMTAEKLLRLADPTQWKSIIGFLRGGRRHGMISNGVYTGVRLKDVLADHPLREDALELVFQGQDCGYDNLRHRLRREKHHYARSLQVRELLEYEPLLCFELNGQPLRPAQGFPLRLVVPGVYGAEHVKWLGSIQAITEPFTGYFQENYYANFVTTQTENGPVERLEPVHAMGAKSMIFKALVRESGVDLYGLAWRGKSPLTEVVVSVDAGPWTKAEPLCDCVDHSWMIWKLTVPGRTSGALSATPRALCVDPDQSQPLTRPDNLFYGNNAVIEAKIDLA